MQPNFLSKVRIVNFYILLFLVFLQLSSWCHVGASIYPINPTYDFFAITGLVSNHSARIMYFSPNGGKAQLLQLVNKDVMGLSLQDANIYSQKFERSMDSLQNLSTVYQFDLEQLRFVESFDLEVTKVIPKAKIISNLLPKMTYIVQFEQYAILFRTLGPQEAYKDDTFRIIALSCDRYIEDTDDTLWNEMAQRQETYDLMIHTGDQIYTDWVYNKRKIHFTTYLNSRIHDIRKAIFEAQSKYLPLWIDAINKSEKLKNIEDFNEIKHLNDEMIIIYFEILEESITDYFYNEFRKVYHVMYERWIVKDIYSRGAHIMLPDDHDIKNNVNYEMVEKSKRDPVLKAFVLAGRLTYYQYQYLLMRDIPDSFDPMDLHSGFDIWNFDLKVDGLCLYLLDTRYETTFRHDGNYPLLGKRQHESFIEALKHCPSDRKIVVFSSVPFVQMDEFMARFVDIVEREYYPTHPEFAIETSIILDKLSPYRHRLLLVSGDIHQYLKTRLIRKNSAKKLSSDSKDENSKNEQNDDPIEILHLTSSSGVSRKSRVMTEFKLVIFNFFLRYFSYSWFKDWKIHHFIQSFSYNYLIIHRGAKAHLYDVEGLTYYGIVLPYNNAKEKFLGFVNDNFVILEIIFLVGIGSLIVYLFTRGAEMANRQKIE